MIYIDQDPRNADWLKVRARARELAAWTEDGIRVQCREAYERYATDVRACHERFCHHLSGGSSQTLAVALLSSAREADPSLAWLPHADSVGRPADSAFEVPCLQRR